MRRSRSASLAAIAAVAALVLAACGGGGGGDGDGDASEGGVFEDCRANPNTCNAVPAAQLQQGGTAHVRDREEHPELEPELLRGQRLRDRHGDRRRSCPTPSCTTPDLKSVLNTDFLVSAELTSTSPQTIVYKIKPEAVWNDGTPITADDFIFNWKTQNGTDCPDVRRRPATAATTRSQSIVGSDGGKTVTVTFGTPYADWQNLFASAYPALPGAHRRAAGRPQHPGRPRGRVRLVRRHRADLRRRGPYQVSRAGRTTSR